MATGGQETATEGTARSGDRRRTVNPDDQPPCDFCVTAEVRLDEDRGSGYVAGQINGWRNEYAIES